MIKPLPGLQSGFKVFVFSHYFLQCFGQDGNQFGLVNQNLIFFSIIFNDCTWCIVD